MPLGNESLTLETANHRERYLDWMVASSPTTLSRWLSEPELRRALATEFDQTLTERVNSLDDVAAYARRCPVAGAGPADYCLRELRPLSDLGVLAGIHFRNLRVDRPFVGVYAQTRDSTESELVEASQQLGREFAHFAPWYVAWWSPEQHDLRGAPGAFNDKRWVVGNLEELRPTPTALPSSFSLARDSSGSSYPAYSRIFEDSLQRNPEWREDTAKTEPSAYEDCARNGLVVELRTGTQTVGIVAARLGSLRGVVGWEMVEEILAYEFRGRSLAPPLQRQFLSALDGARAPLVWGTIAARNEPSLRTALRVGRKDVGGWVFIPAQANPIG